MKVLVVDDEPEVCELVRVVLEADGHDVVTAPDGRAALDALADPAIGAVVLDVMMPGLGGVDVLGKVDGGLPVLILTALAEPDLERRCLAAGASAVMTKPFRVPALQAAVRALVARS